jgi:hypothetical protein
LSTYEIEASVEVEPLWISDYADPHLRFRLEFDFKYRHALAQLQADVSVCTDKAGSNPIGLGPLCLDPEAVMVAHYADKRQVTMLLRLTKSAIERIEEQRARSSHRKVLLRVRGFMKVLFVEPFLETAMVKGAVVSIEQQPLKLMLTSHEPISVYRFQKVIEIASSTWSEEYLERFGFGKYASVEIPMDLTGALEKAEAATEKALAERIVNSSKLAIDADKSMRKGDWEKAVGDARRALEPLAKENVTYQGEQISITKAIKELFRRDGFPQDVRDAVTKIVDNFMQFTSPAHHVQVKPSEEEIEMKTPFDKEDAQFAVGTLILLLNMLTKKLTKA